MIPVQKNKCAHYKVMIDRKESVAKRNVFGGGGGLEAWGATEVQKTSNKTLCSFSLSLFFFSEAR